MQLLKHIDACGLERSGRAGVQDEVVAMPLFWKYTTLREACYAKYAHFCSVIVRDPARTLAIDPTCTYLRLRSAPERLQAFVEAYASNCPPDTQLDLMELMENPYIRQLFCESELPTKPFLDWLHSCELFEIPADANVRHSADFLRLRPRPERVRLGIERLLLEPDANLKQKMQQTRGGVPLTWLLENYAVRLGGSEQRLGLPEAAAALRDSQEVHMTPDTYRVQLRSNNVHQLQPVGEQAKAISANAGVRAALKPAHLQTVESLLGVRVRRGNSWYLPHNECPQTKTWSSNSRYVPLKPTISDKDVRKLCGILEHYFEPFGLQTIRLVLHTARRDSWTWPLSELTKRLTRIGDEVNKFRHALRSEFLKRVAESGLKHLRLIMPERDEPFIELTYEPDVRFPVLVPKAEPWLRHLFLEYANETHLMPASAALVVSYAVGREEGAPEDLNERRRWHNRVARQLLAYMPDIICVQQCEANLDEFRCCDSLRCHSEAGTNETSLAVRSSHPSMSEKTTLFGSLCDRLELEDFEWCAAPASAVSRDMGWDKRVNIIFWRRSRWRAESCRQVGPGGALLAVLSSRLNNSVPKLNVACLEASDSEDLRQQVAIASPYWQAPLALCGTFGEVSPPEVGATLRRETHDAQAPKRFGEGFRSAHVDILGAEPAWTWATGGYSVPKCSDGIWLAGDTSMRPLAALAGPQCAPPIDPETGRVCRFSHPVDHLPILSAFEFAAPVERGRAALLDEALSPQACAAAGA
eukprot:TRINITY_DN15057_c0_g1_i1.p1 TRINITY_DN15057_c0_g1~~TRINITY_DN15057_c0_g1_i1.p1  ORF type:complete len:811 (+),score=173.85 TRINITY_DN15057_c0_g1_i1:170-2434(+)